MWDADGTTRSGLGHLLDRLAREQGFSVVDVQPIDPGAALTTAELEALAALVGTLRRIRPGQPGATFLPGVAAVFSLAEQVAQVRARLEAFLRFASGAAVYPIVREACGAWDPPGAIARLLDRAIGDVPAAELEARVPAPAWGFTQGDLAPHNVLVQPGGQVCLVDFEYSGWDDPVAPAAAFLAADTSRGLTPDGAAAFVSAYREAAELTAGEVRRLDRLRVLMEVNWAAVHLSLLTPERIAPKQFADPRFDLDRHLAEQLDKLRCRLAVAAPAARPGWDQ